MDLISDIRDFLTPDKKKRNNVYLVDADNYQAGIVPMLENKKTALVVCVSSSAVITNGIYAQVEGKTKVRNKLTVHSVAPGKDSTDIFVASLLGWMACKYGRDYNYYVVSGDRIFEPLRDEYRLLGYNVDTIREV